MSLFFYRKFVCLFAILSYNEYMIILGIDPGYGITGFGVIEKTKDGLKCLDYGVIETPKNESLPVRLAMLYDGLVSIIKNYKVDEIAIEELFFAKNTKTAIQVAEGRGVIALASIQHTGRVFEYTPMQIKLALTGQGRADKTQVEFMVKAILGIDKKIRPDDASDALAIAICHSQTNPAFKDGFMF